MREKARLASLGLPHAGDWLYAIPSPGLTLHLRSSEFTMAVNYRIGCPLYTTAGKCPACPKFSDVYGDHAISCGTEGERIARHNHLRDTLYHTCASAALAPTKLPLRKAGPCCLVAMPGQQMCSSHTGPMVRTQPGTSWWSTLCNRSWFLLLPQQLATPSPMPLTGKLPGVGWELPVRGRE